MNNERSCREGDKDTLGWQSGNEREREKQTGLLSSPQRLSISSSAVNNISYLNFSRFRLVFEIRELFCKVEVLPFTFCKTLKWNFVQIRECPDESPEIVLWPPNMLMVTSSISVQIHVFLNTIWRFLSDCKTNLMILLLEYDYLLVIAFETSISIIMFVSFSF